MTTALVTGGAGFLGSHLSEYLVRAGHEVVVLDDLSGGYWRNVVPGCKFVRESVLNTEVLGELFARHRFDFVFHLAAYAAEGMSHFIRSFNYETNLLGSAKLINAAINHDVKCFVFTSSAAVYGSVANADRATMLAPADPYAIAKLAVEQDLHAAANIFGLRYVVFRPHNVYGQRQSLSDPFRNVIGIFFKQIMRGEPCTIFGDGSQTRNFSYVDDVIPVLARSVEMPGAYDQTFDVGSDQATSLSELAATMQEMMGRQVGVRYLPPRREAQHVGVDHSNTRRVFGNTECIGLEEGLRRTAEWAKTLELAPPRSRLHLEVEKNLPSAWRDVFESAEA